MVQSVHALAGTAPPEQVGPSGVPVAQVLPMSARTRRAALAPPLPPFTRNDSCEWPAVEKPPVGALKLTAVHGPIVAEIEAVPAYTGEVAVRLWVAQEPSVQGLTSAS